jgi:hypothetical protein
VAEARLGISEPTLHRVETGKVPVTVANVRALCWLYGADESITSALAELALGTSQAEWWDASPVIPDWFKLYVGLEASAGRIGSYDGEVVPGELQSEQYARAVFGAEQPVDMEAAERQVKLRVQRQKALFARTPAPQLVTVLGEGALTRLVGGDAVLEAQIEHLRRVAQRDNVEIRSGCCPGRWVPTPRWPGRFGSWISTTPRTRTWCTWSPTWAPRTWRKRMRSTSTGGSSS